MGAHKGLLPTLNYLVALEAAARLGSFRAAADEMFLTQGAVAQQIRALEKEIGIPLFDRLPRGLRVNKKGQEYINRLNLAFGIIEEATKGVTTIESRLNSSRIHLSTTPSFASRWLIPRLPLLNEIHPDISLMIDASESVRSFKGEDGIDMSIRWGFPPFPEGHTHFLHGGRATPVCSPKLLAGKDIFSVEDIFRLPLISDSHNNWKSWFETYVGPHSDNMLKISGPSFSHTNHALEAAEQGMGIALIPNLLVENAVTSGTLVHAMDDHYQLESKSAFYIITAEEAPDNTCLRKVIDWLLDQAKTHY